MGVAQHLGARIRPPVDQRGALGPGVAQKGILAAPEPDLEELLPEHTLQRPPDQALLCGDATPSQRRAQPAIQGGRLRVHYPNSGTQPSESQSTRPVYVIQCGHPGPRRTPNT